MIQKTFFLVFVTLIFGHCKSPAPVEATTFPIQFNDRPKNIILMIGDGMGLGQISASVYDTKQKQPFELFQHIGLQKTYAYNDLITDSAAAATAMACGEKTYRNAIGITKDTIPCTSILEEAEAKGLATGLVATSSIVHATPASFYGHQKLRNFYEYLAIDLIDAGIDFLVGGGKQYFIRRATDDRNLLTELENKGYRVTNYTPNVLKKMDGQARQPAIIFTAAKRPQSALEGRSYLPPVAKKAPEFLKDYSDKGFFLMIEGSQIDWAGHANEGGNVLLEMADFNRSIENVLEFVNKNKETLLIVTADHETGGLAINKDSKVGKLNLSFTANDHTGTMVPVFAYGPQAELFRGIYDNTEIYHKMRQALGWE
jgi:alkaline phosphatase